MSLIIIHIIYITNFIFRTTFNFNWLNSILLIKNIDIFYRGKRGPTTKSSKFCGGTSWPELQVFSDWTWNGVELWCPLHQGRSCYVCESYFLSKGVRNLAPWLATRIYLSQFFICVARILEQKNGHRQLWSLQFRLKIVGPSVLKKKLSCIAISPDF